MSQHAVPVLSPKQIPTHPRLAPIPAIHFDHYNSSVTDCPGPYQDRERMHYVRNGVLLGTCLNFMQDHQGETYAFCGHLETAALTTVFSLVRLDLPRLRPRDAVQVARLRTLDILRGELPMYLGYFMMDHEGHVIVVREHTTIEFMKYKDDRIRTLKSFALATPLRDALERYAGAFNRDQIATQRISQVMPAYGRGYWFVAFGKGSRPNQASPSQGTVPAYVGMLSDTGELQDLHVFEGEVIENGFALDASGAYIVTDWALYKYTREADGKIRQAWRQPYTRSSTQKKGTLCAYGSGSAPTLQGVNDDLVTITDNADKQIRVNVYDRTTGTLRCQKAIFPEHESANENTLVGYGDTIVAQNWFNAPNYRGTLSGLKPGLIRLDLSADRTRLDPVWENREFATTATARLSTHTGLIYGTIQLGGRDRYAMGYVDFATGEQVCGSAYGRGKTYRIAMSPAYFLPEIGLLQPTRGGVVVLNNA